jgi:uncharacterized protein YjbJ (UPF0337 family)
MEEGGDDEILPKESIEANIEAAEIAQASADVSAKSEVNTEADKQAKQAALKNLGDMANGDKPLIPNDNPYTKDAIDALKKQQDLFVKAVQAKYPDFKWDDTKSIKENIASNNTEDNEFFGKIKKKFSDLFGSDKESLEKAKEKADAESEKSTGNKKESSKTLSYVLGSLLTAGVSVSGILLGLWAAAEAKNGCYQYQPGKGQKTVKLNSCDKPNTDTCNCNQKIADLQKLCNEITANQTCPSDSSGDKDWMYVYRHFSIFDIINDVITEIGDAENQLAGGFGQVLDFFAKYGVWFFIGIAVIILLVIGVPIIKSAMG